MRTDSAGNISISRIGRTFFSPKSGSSACQIRVGNLFDQIANSN